MSRFSNFGKWLFAVVAGIGLGAVAVGLSQPSGTPAPLDVPAAPSPQDLSMAFRHVAAQSLPAVVSIHTTSGERSSRRRAPLNEDLFREFFKNHPNFDEIAPEEFDRMFPEFGTGSGFIIDSRGIILTNSHVVEGAEQVIIRLYDGRQFRASSWDYDPRSDVAIVRIETSEPLPIVPLGDSDAMQVGDWVLAMGNPFDVGTTVTAGIISATGRGPGINEREDYLQTDAAINPGNSGGPLVNLNGHVVGINTAISTRSGGYDGVGFSIPINMGRWVADQLIEFGYVRRSYLGVALQELDGAIREHLGVPLGQGTLVGQVFPNTPAQAAGLQPGDVVLRMDGREITSRGHLQEIVERIVPGTSVECIVLRDGRERELQVVLEEMPRDFTPAMQRGQRRQEPATPETEEEQAGVSFDELGLEFAEINAGHIAEHGLPKETTGAVIISIRDGSPAFEAGLKVGEVVTRVNRQDVRSMRDLEEALRNASFERGILLQVLQGEASRFVLLKQDE